jgi:hypothetical protein
MKFTSKNYKIIKTKDYMKKNNLFFFFGGVNRNSNDWILVEQSLKNMNFNYYKIFNKTTKKTLTDSIFNTIKPAINGIKFLIKPKTKQISKQILMTSFEPLLFNMLAIKLNNKIYQATQLKNSYSLNYKDSKLLICQFGIVNLKKKSK